MKNEARLPAGKQGFTLFELIIAIGIMATIFGVALSSYNTFNRRQRLIQTALTFKSNVRFAQTKALSAEKPNIGCTTFVGMNLSFTLSSYAITHECSEGLVGDAVTVTLPPGITFSTLPTDITFVALKKLISPGGGGQTITFVNSNETYSVDITPTGDVQL